MSESVTVGVRIRPLNKRELSSNAPHIAWTSQDNQITRTHDGVASTNAMRSPSHSFCFDAVFNHHSTNDQVYQSLAAPVVESALGGFNATIFAYGQTSSGKTHSMLGDTNDPGITPLAIRHVLATTAGSRTRNYLVRAVYVEIYNDRIRDLLNPSAADLAVREDKAGRVFVDAHETIVDTFEDAIAVLEKGQSARHVGETKMNARSSRSHTVFTLLIESKSVEGLDASFRASSLNLVDLAGSERLKSTGAAGKRQKEGAHINQSLLVLGTIINRLSAAGADASKIGHLPYRDSKLTRLLRPALGGNARTAVLCAVTPAAAHIEETLSSLKFAERAKKVSTNATRNEVVDYRAKWKEASTEVTVLRERVESLQKELAVLHKRDKKSRPVEAEGSVLALSPTRDAGTSSSCTEVTSSSSSSSVSSMSGRRGAEDVSAASSDHVEADTARAIALRAAQDELTFVKARVEEVETENEHLRARLTIKASEFSTLRKRAVELRSKARSADMGERKVRRALKNAYGRLEEARRQLSVSRKKGAHVLAAELILSELSTQVHNVVHGGPADDSRAHEQRVVPALGDGIVGGSGASGSGGGGGGSEASAVTQLALAYGSSATTMAALYGGATVVATADARGDDSKVRVSGMSRRRPRPLPEDMVADIDDSDGSGEGGDGTVDEKWEDFDAMEVVELGDETGSSGDRASGGDRSTSSKKKKSKWRSLRNFYGYTDGVYDEMMGGHKLDKGHV